MEIWGWAWADDGIDRVDISTDGGATWSAAEVEAREDWCWQRFRALWRPGAAGAVALCSRATSRGGTMQPVGGRRNAIHRVDVSIA